MKHFTFLMKSVFIILSCFLTIQISTAQTPAFPGAEGHGRYTTGGRGGKVYYVTNLSDDGQPGSLRYAIEQKGTRTVVFNVSGTIYLKSQLKVINDNITIAGQSAPGDGICIADYPFVISCNNVIIRYLRFRLGDRYAQEADGLGGMDKKNIIIDHCSISWSTDECCSVYGCDSITLQWNLISQSLRNSVHDKGTHGYGAIWGGALASYHHNLLAHHDSRTPRFGSRPGTVMREVTDMRNNVIYNWAGHGCYGLEGMNINIVNNYYKPGPATKKASAGVRYRIAKIGLTRTESCISSINGTDTIWNAWYPKHHVWGKYFVDGNVVEGYDDVTKDNWTKGIYAQIVNSECDYKYTSVTKDTIKIDIPLATDYITTHTAEDAFDRVMDYVGASLVRDELDAVVINDTRTGTATYGNSGGYPGFIDTQTDVKPADAADNWTPWPSLIIGDDVKMANYVDTDGDGIPDVWEKANDMDWNDPSDGNYVNRSGYTNLELYLNSLVAHITRKQNDGGVVLEDTGSLNGSVSNAISNVLNDFKPCVYAANGKFFFENVEISSIIQIYNVNGVLIKAITAENSDFCINLPKGIHLVRITSSSKSKTFKVVNT